MFTHLTDTTKAIVFYALAFAMAVAIALLPDAPVHLYMATPLMAAALMLFIVTRDGYTRAGLKSLGLHRLGLRGWGPAIFIPMLALGFAYSVVWTTGLADLSIPATIGRNDTPVIYLPLLALLTIIIAALTVVLGEEIGWRGYLLPRLEALGRGRAMLITGLLHATWHLPLIFLTSQYHSEGSLLITMPLFFVSVALVGGVFIGYLRFATGSVWPASIAHAAHNVIWDVLSGFTVGATPLVSEYLAGEGGILTNLAYAVLVGWLIYRWNKRKQPAQATASIRQTAEMGR
jgi:membrane protease YdiL (CAAX protease family)